MATKRSNWRTFSMWIFVLYFFLISWFCPIPHSTHHTQNFRISYALISSWSVMDILLPQFSFHSYLYGYIYVFFLSTLCCLCWLPGWRKLWILIIIFRFFLCFPPLPISCFSLLVPSVARELCYKLRDVCHTYTRIQHIAHKNEKKSKQLHLQA